MNISYTILYWDNNTPTPVHAVYNTLDGSFTMLGSDDATKPVTTNADGLEHTIAQHTPHPHTTPTPTPHPPSKESITSDFRPLGYMYTPLPKTW
jgi:hypothetical protein